MLRYLGIVIDFGGLGLGLGLECGVQIEIKLR
jgi:hypothetical protein